MLQRILFSLILILLSTGIKAQDTEKVLSGVFDEALTDFTAYRNLEYLCKNTKGRIDGSTEAEKAVEFTRQALIKAGADSVWLQKVPVPVWKRGIEKCRILSSVTGDEDLSITALGLSDGTTSEGLSSKVVEVHDFDELKSLGSENITGKIVFFNRPVDNTLINTFAGYAGAVNQRTAGASEAAQYGAIAVIVRSATQSLDDYPHTGVMHYKEGVNRIPAVSVSTIGADLLSKRLKKDPSLKLVIISTCKNYPDAWSSNVIGEIRGSEKPNEIITVGGHLDAWDIAEGAHDDAGGCVQAIEMIRLYKKLGIKPKRTIRAVMFMNEEISSTGGKSYAEEAKRRGEIHYAALESDRGVMSPRGFGFDADGDRLDKLRALSFMVYTI